MRLWLSRNSAASLREQLATQLTLGVISGDLRAGERLASVRELARAAGCTSAMCGNWRAGSVQGRSSA
jgi:DNA-binding transcriptional regulator YhcF (GntR family)